MRLNTKLRNGRGPLLALSAACLFAAATAASAQTMAQPAKPGTQKALLGTTAPGRPPPPRAMMPMQPAPMPSKPDDPAKVAAARDFIMAYHPQMNPLNISAKIDRVLPNMVKAAKEQNPKLDVKKFASERRVMLMKQAAGVLDMQSHVVSRHFSLQELQQLTAFFRGPLGRKLGEEVPKIQMDIMQEGRRQLMQRLHIQSEPAKPAPGRPPAKPH